MLGREVDLRPFGDARERDAVRAIEAADEPAGRFERRLAPPGPDAGSIDDQHDQTAADRLDVRRIVRRGGNGQSIRAAADRHELGGDNLTAPAVDAHLEIGGAQVADRLALSVDHVDVHPNQIE